MAQDDDRRRTFEARLAELKLKMEAGLIDRARALREAAARLLAGDESARRVLKQEGHKLRGVAGSYGHDHLTEMAGDLEQRASLSPPPLLDELARNLAHAAEEVGLRSTQAQSEAKQSTREAPVKAPVTAAAPAPAKAASASAPASSTSTPADSGASSSSPSRKRGGSVRPTVAGGDGGRLRVLAMDDDPTTLRLLRLTLNDIGGFDAVIVTSAREALVKMREREFDAIISDAMMPDMNGKEFCEAARELGGWAAKIPIVILSAATSDELGWREGMTGPIEWMRKPFMPSSLVRDIARVVDAHRKRRG